MEWIVSIMIYYVAWLFSLILDWLFLTLAKIGIFFGVAVNHIRYYLETSVLEKVMTEVFRAIGVEDGVVSNLFLFAVLTAIMLIGLSYVLRIFFPESRRWINVQNLIVNGTFAVLFFSFGMKFIQTVETIRITMYDTVSSSIYDALDDESYSTVSEIAQPLIPGGVNIDSVNCEGEIGDGVKIGCLSGSAADTTAAFIGVRNQGDLASLGIPTLFETKFLPQLSSDQGNFETVRKFTIEKLLPGVMQALIGSLMLIVCFLEAVSLLMLDLTALMLFAAIPLAIVFSFFSKTQSFMSSLIDRYIQTFITTIIVAVMMPVIVGLATQVGGYLGYFLGGMIAWGAGLMIISKPSLEAFDFAISGAFQSIGLGGFGSAMKDVAGTVGALGLAAATGGTGLALGAAGNAASGLISKVGGEKAKPWADKVKTVGQVGQNVAMMGLGQQLKKTPLGQPITTIAALSRMDGASLGSTLKYSSAWDSVTTGAAAGDGMMSLMYATDRMKMAADRNMGRRALDNDSQALSDAGKAINEGRFTDGRMAELIAPKVGLRGRFLEQPASAAKEMQDSVKEGMRVGLLTDGVFSSAASGVTTAQSVKTIDGYVVLTRVMAAQNGSSDQKEATREVLERQLGASGANAAITLASSEVHNQNSLAVVQASYDQALRDVQAANPGVDVVRLLRDPNGGFSQQAPLRQAFEQALQSNNGGDLMTNAKSQAAVLDYVTSISQVYKPISSIEIAQDVSQARSVGVSPTVYVQQKHNISNEVMRGEVGQMITYFDQNPEPEVAPVLNTLSSISDPTQIQHLNNFSEKMQTYMQQGAARGDATVMQIVEPTKTGFRQVQATETLVQQMVSQNIVTKDEYNAFKTLVTTTQESQGMDKRAIPTLTHRTLETLRGMPTKIEVRVNPK